MRLLVLACSLSIALTCGVQAEPPKTENVSPTFAERVKSLRLAPDNELIETAKYLIENWEQALPGLIEEISAFDHSQELQANMEQSAFYFLTITDIVRSIILNKKGAVEEFRKVDDARVIDSLAWAARVPNKDIRLNSTFILAAVVHNGNICIILHHLRDKKLDGNGRINLLQVAQAVASYAYRETVLATNGTIEVVRNNIAKSTSGTGQTDQHLEVLIKRLKAGPYKDMPLPKELSYCKDYDYRRALNKIFQE